MAAILLWLVQIRNSLASALIGGLIALIALVLGRPSSHVWFGVGLAVFLFVVTLAWQRFRTHQRVNAPAPELEDLRRGQGVVDAARESEGQVAPFLHALEGYSPQRATTDLAILNAALKRRGKVQGHLVQLADHLTAKAGFSAYNQVFELLNRYADGEDTFQAFIEELRKQV